MAANKVRDLWTTFITAFFALLASIGLTSVRSAAAAQPVAQTPELPALPQQERKGDGARAVVPAQSRRWRPAVRERSLPPTIKQRISAEAHGSSPSVRKLPILDADPIGTAIAGARPGSSRARWLGRGSAAQQAVETGAVNHSTGDAHAAHASANIGVEASASAGAPAVEGDRSTSGGRRNDASSKEPVAPVVPINPVGLDPLGPDATHSRQVVSHQGGSPRDSRGALDGDPASDQERTLVHDQGQTLVHDQGEHGVSGVDPAGDTGHGRTPDQDGAEGVAGLSGDKGADGVEGVEGPAGGLDQSQGDLIGADHGRVLDLDQYRALTLESDADDDHPGTSQTLSAA